MKLKEILIRSWYYYPTGYGRYISYPLGIIGFATSIYYLAIRNIPFLAAIFTQFHVFVVLVMVVVYSLGAIIGWWHFHKSPFFKKEQEIIAESNPFAYDTLQRISLPTWKLFRQMALNNGMRDVVEEMDEIIQRSIKHWER